MTNKTVPTDESVKTFIESVEHQGRREDAFTMLAMLEDITGLPAKMWGKNLIGFGQYHYKYDSGREGDFFRIGFSPRKANLVVYVMPGLEQFSAQLEQMGKHKTGKSCLYLTRLSKIDTDVLRQILVDSLKIMAERYPES